MPKAIQRNGDFYLSDPRPPVVADYFDPKLSRELMVGMTAKEVRLGYTVGRHRVPVPYRIIPEALRPRAPRIPVERTELIQPVLRVLLRAGP